MDTNAAYWTEDANGNLLVYNGQGQFLDTVPKAAAPTFVARFSQGQRDMSQDYSPEAQSSGGSNGPAWANVGLRGQELNQSAAQFGQNLAEERRQFNERLWADKSMFDQRMALDTVTQRWREAVDSRDFEAAEYWKARAQELNQNQLAMQYTNLLASQTGPQDWIKYGRLSRGESPTSDENGRTIPLDQALPAWAQGFKPQTYTDSRGIAGPTLTPQNTPIAQQPVQREQPRQQGPVVTAKKQVIDLSGGSFGNAKVVDAPWKGQPKNMPTNAVLGVMPGGQAGSLSDYAVAELKKNPAWATQLGLK